MRKIPERRDGDMRGVGVICYLTSGLMRRWEQTCGLMFAAVIRYQRTSLKPEGGRSTVCDRPDLHLLRG